MDVLMKAHAARFLTVPTTMALAAWIWCSLPARWIAWSVAVTVLLIGAAVADAIFHRLASSEVSRADLEDRVRNPPP
jgi:hypothetical protein